MTVWFNNDSLYYFYGSKAQIKSKNHHNMSVVVCRFIHFDSPQFLWIFDFCDRHQCYDAFVFKRDVWEPLYWSISSLFYTHQWFLAADPGPCQASKVRRLRLRWCSPQLAYNGRLREPASGFKVNVHWKFASHGDCWAPESANFLAEHQGNFIQAIMTKNNELISHLLLENVSFYISFSQK